MFVVPLIASAMAGVATGAAAAVDIPCSRPVDIVQVQDMTSSFDARWPAMSAQIGTVIDALYALSPDTRFGFATFGDKPLETETPNYYALGYEFDYCLHVDVQISSPTPQKMTELFQHYTETAQGGGGDWPEGVMEGLQRALLAPQMGWQIRKGAARVLVVVTDATSHLPGDVKKFVNIDVPSNNLTCQDMESNENNDCSIIDYPSFQQVADIITEMGATVIFLVAPGGSYDKDGKFSPAASLANYGKKYWTENGLQLWYEDQFAKVGVTAIVETIDPKMEVYAEAFISAMNRFVDGGCGPTTEPTAEPTTTIRTMIGVTERSTTSAGPSVSPTAGTTDVSTVEGSATTLQATVSTGVTVGSGESTDANGSTEGGNCCGDCCEESCGCGFSEIQIQVNVIFGGRSENNGTYNVVPNVPIDGMKDGGLIKLPALRLLNSSN